MGGYKSEAQRKKREPNEFLQNFEPCLANLVQWVKERGYLPWSKGMYARERNLAKWVEKVRTAYAANLLGRTQIAQLEAIRRWTWKKKTPKAVKSKQATCAPDSPGTKDKRLRQTYNNDVGSEKFPLEVHGLASELSRQPTASARRACLRRWQLEYHPDKNLGRDLEVLPMFRWVQSQWEREGMQETASN